MEWCVYRFLDENNNVIYVGQAKDLVARIRNHFSKSRHLPDECYRETEAIEYISCDNVIDMNIKEIYFINKYKPRYNKKIFMMRI